MLWNGFRHETAILILGLIDITVTFLHYLLDKLSTILTKTTKQNPLPKSVTTTKKLSIHSITILIPVYNEAETIEKFIRRVILGATNPQRLHLIFCYARSSTDDSLIKIKDTLSKLGDRVGSHAIADKNCFGRGKTIASGVELIPKNTDAVAILHSDTFVFKGFDDVVVNQLSDPKVIMGAFDYRDDALSGKEQAEPSLREYLLQCRMHWSWTPEGDMMQFFRKDVFEYIGGCPNTLMMEDVVMGMAARRLAFRCGGRVVIHPLGIACSLRREEELGAVYSLWINVTMWSAYVVLGMSIERIFRMYYGKKVADKLDAMRVD